MVIYWIYLVLLAALGGCDESREQEQALERARQLQANWAPKLEAASGHLTKLGRRLDRLPDERSRALRDVVTQASTDVMAAKQALLAVTPTLDATEPVDKAQNWEEQFEQTVIMLERVVNAVDTQLYSARGKLAALESELAQRADQSRFTTAFVRTLPSGFVVSCPEKGTEHLLLEYLDRLDERGADAGSSPWFHLDHITFDADAADVDLQVGRGQLENVTHILEDYPSVTLKVATYDSVSGGELDALAVRRVASVVDQLVAHGVQSERLEMDSMTLPPPDCLLEEPPTCVIANLFVAVQVLHRQ